jgi:hypothetical protein
VKTKGATRSGIEPTPRIVRIKLPYPLLIKAVPAASVGNTGFARPSDK